MTAKDEPSLDLFESLIDAVRSVLGVVAAKGRFIANLEKAASTVLLGAAGLWRAKLDANTIDKRSEAEARHVVRTAAATAVAEQFGKDSALANRAAERFGAQLFMEQENRETVFGLATESLIDDPPRGDASADISQDWLNHFAGIAERTSDADMQAHLANILAGEIKKPGSFSAATIASLTTLSKADAIAFEIFAT